MRFSFEQLRARDRRARQCTGRYTAVGEVAAIRAPRVDHGFEPMRRSCIRHIAAVLAIFVAAIGTTSAGAVVHRTAGGTTAVHIVLGKPSEMGFSFGRQSDPRGAVVFRLTNRGVVSDDLSIDRKTPGGKATLDMTFSRACSYPYECTVPGTAAAGMRGVLKVTLDA